MNWMFRRVNFTQRIINMSTLSCLNTTGQKKSQVKSNLESGVHSVFIRSCSGASQATWIRWSYNIYKSTTTAQIFMFWWRWKGTTESSRKATKWTLRIYCLVSVLYQNYTFSQVWNKFGKPCKRNYVRWFLFLLVGPVQSKRDPQKSLRKWVLSFSMIQQSYEKKPTYIYIVMFRVKSCRTVINGACDEYVSSPAVSKIKSELHIWSQHGLELLHMVLELEYLHFHFHGSEQSQWPRLIRLKAQEDVLNGP